MMKLGTKIAGGAAALVASGALTLFSPTLQSFLGKWEGDGKNVVYADKLARGLPTVCKGITKHTSPEPLVVGDYWSPERCEQIERLGRMARPVGWFAGAMAAVLTLWQTIKGFKG